MKTFGMTAGRVLVARMSHGEDLLEELTSFCTREKVRAASLTGLGAVRKAILAYYNQSAKQYESHTLNQPMEIVSLTGNVSIKDGNPFVHAHLAVADASGQVHGGHLMPGTILFAGEVVLRELCGPELIRGYDEITALHLWR